jgi:hypothetical protein
LHLTYGLEDERFAIAASAIEPVVPDASLKVMPKPHPALAARLPFPR